MMRSIAVSQFAQPLAIASVAGAAALGGFLLFRRAIGALEAPLPLPQLLATTAVLLAWIICLNVVAMSANRPKRFVIRWVTIAVAICFAFACSTPTIRAADWLVWLPTIAITAVAPEFVTWARRTAGSASRIRRYSAHSNRSHATVNHFSGQNDAEINSGEQTLQQLTRVRSADGTETIQATLTAEILPGQRAARLFVGFCPPFEFVPEVEVSVCDGPDAHVKVAQLLHNGAELDVQLSQIHAATQHVVIELLAGERSEPDRAGGSAESLQ